MVDRGRLNFCKDLSFVDPRIRSQAPTGEIVLLDPDYEPGYWDVICQGGKESYDHIGNRRFRVCIDNNLNTYVKAKTKHEKSMVVTVIVDAVKESSTQKFGGFVRKDLPSGRWYEVEDKIAREKVGHALRDAIKLRQKQEKNKVSPTEPEQSRPSKKRRVNTNINANTPCEEKTEPKQTQFKPSLVSSLDKQIIPADEKNEWENSLSESAEQFAATASTKDDSSLEGDSDEESRSGDSVLNEMALATSNEQSAEDTEKAYQKSLAQLEMAGEDDSFSLGSNSHDVLETPAAAEKPLPELSSSTDTKPDGVGAGAGAGAFDDFMKRFLGTSSAVAATRTGTQSTSTKFEWKPPGDSSTEAAFETFMHNLKPPPQPLGLKGAPEFMKQPNINNYLPNFMGNFQMATPGNITTNPARKTPPSSKPNLIGDLPGAFPPASINILGDLNNVNDLFMKMSQQQPPINQSGDSDQGPTLIDDLF